MLRDLDIAPSHISDARRLEVIAEGLTLFGGSQLAIDATVVSPLHADGTHRRKSDTTDGQALAEARKHKERTYPELCRGNGRARLVVIAGEVGGRWSQETKDFLWCLASAKAACVPRSLRERTSSMVQTLELSSGLFHGKVGRFISVGCERIAWGWRRGAFRQ